MAIREKPKEFHCQCFVYAKDSITGHMPAGSVVDVTKREVKASIYDSKQTFLREQRDGHPKLQGQSYESHIWIVNLIDVGRNLAYRKLRAPLTRSPNVLEAEFTAPDIEDRFIKLADRKWKFIFNAKHITDLEEDGEIDLTRAESEAIIKRTDGDDEIFSWLN